MFMLLYCTAHSAVREFDYQQGAATRCNRPGAYQKQPDNQTTRQSKTARVKQDSSKRCTPTTAHVTETTSQYSPNSVGHGSPTQHNSNHTLQPALSQPDCTHAATDSVTRPVEHAAAFTQLEYVRRQPQIVDGVPMLAIMQFAKLFTQAYCAALGHGSGTHCNGHDNSTKHTRSSDCSAVHARAPSHAHRMHHHAHDTAAYIGSGAAKLAP